jgi:hypothetical protein
MDDMDDLDVATATAVSPPLGKLVSELLIHLGQARFTA